MGNHEFNAVAFKTPHPEEPGERLRPDTEESRKQHAAFREQQGEYSALHEEMGARFMRLPLYLDLDELRAVDAGWHAASLETLKTLADPRQCLYADAWKDAARKGMNAYNAAEIPLKGLEIPLPAAQCFLDKDGHERQHIRTRWWTQGFGTYRSVAMLDDATRETLSDEAVPGDVLPGYTDESPSLSVTTGFAGHLSP